MPTINVNAPIDPPLIGAAAVTIGGGNATVNVNANIDAILLGAGALNIGSGSAIVNVSATGSIGQGGTAVPLFGIAAIDILGTGDAIAVVNGNIAADINGVTVIKALGDGNVVVAGALTARWPALVRSAQRAPRSATTASCPPHRGRRQHHRQHGGRHLCRR